jgi:ornithine carbamoyltransferase
MGPIARRPAPGSNLPESPSVSSHKRDFLAITDFSREDHYRVLDRAHRLKSGEEPSRGLEGKTLAMIFRKSSTRTRVSFEVGTFQLGGHAVFLSDQHSQMGRGESIHDTAEVLSRFVDGIMIRTFAHSEVEALAAEASVPVINGLTDLLHPCQVVSDIMTVQESFGRDVGGLRVAWIGDGNNMANSWINAARVYGFELRLACPEGHDPDPQILDAATASGLVSLTRSPTEAAEGAHVLTTDVWASMGQEDEQEARAEAFVGYVVDQGLMSRADPSAIFLHCLPAHRGEEVTAEVIDGPASRVFDEAENRLHAQKSIMLELMG